MAEHLKKTFSGKLLLKEISLFSGAMAVTSSLALVYGVLRFTIPYVIRTIEYKNPVHLFKWDSWVYSVCELTMGFIVPLLNFTFVMAGVIDF